MNNILKLDHVKANIAHAERDIENIRIALGFDLGKHAEKKLYDMLAKRQNASKVFQAKMNDLHQQAA